MGVRFDVDAQYSLLDVVGQGAYGVVCAALDEDSGETVAIKKITNAFEHELYAKRTLREIRLLRLLKHDNLIGLKIILPPLKSDGFKDLYKLYIDGVKVASGPFSGDDPIAVVR